MKLDEPKNPDYAAIVVRVQTLVPLADCDNIVGMPVFGYQAIVGKDTKVGDLGLFFPAECQLSDAYVKANNLYKHADKNSNPEAKGYLEDNRRVRALTLRKHRSDALFMPLSSLNFGFPNTALLLEEGDTFDTLGGVEICRKYINGHPGPYTPAQPKQEPRVDERYFPEQFYISNFLKAVDHIDPNAYVTVTQKLHGTNIRVGNIPVARKLTWKDRIAKALGVKVEMTEYDVVYGSHHVIKDANNPNQNHFYDHDLWSEMGRRAVGWLPKGYLIFGELIGWVPGSADRFGTGTPIQKHYTYDLKPGECALYVYRIVNISPSGRTTDLSWEAVKEFCDHSGLKHVPELVTTKVSYLGGIPGPLWSWMDKNLLKDGYPQAVPLSPDSPCDEGVCIRIEGITPRIYKVKSPKFLAHETKMLDANVPDIEADEVVS